MSTNNAQQKYKKTNYKNSIFFAGTCT